MGLRKKLFFSGVLLLLLFLFSELLFGVYFYFKAADSFLYGKILTALLPARETTIYKIPFDPNTDKYRPGQYVSEQWDVTYTINRLGFRNRPFDPDQKSKFRIFVCGGSSTAGLEVSDDETFPFYLEQILNDQGFPVEVINAGISGKDLYRILRMIRDELVHYQPDLILINSVRNTVMKGRAQGGDMIRNFVQMNASSKILGWHGWCKENVMLYRGLHRNYIHLRSLLQRNQKGGVTVGNIDVNTDFFNKDFPQLLENIYQISQANKVRLGFIMEPIHVDAAVQGALKDSPRQTLLKNFTEPDFEFPDEQRQYLIVGTTLLYQNLAQMAKKHPDVLLVDPREDFLWKKRNTDDLFYDDVHLKAQGNKLLAQNIARVVQDAF